MNVNSFQGSVLKDVIAKYASKMEMESIPVKLKRSKRMWKGLIEDTSNKKRKIEEGSVQKEKDLNQRPSNTTIQTQQSNQKTISENSSNAPPQPMSPQKPTAQKNLKMDEIYEILKGLTEEERAEFFQKLK